MAVQYGLPVFGTLGAIGVVYAAFCAFAQKDIKLMAAYSSVSHLGLLVLGVFALNPEGLTGGVLHMVNHGLTAGAMFALVAVLYNRYRTTDMTKFGGLMATHPRFAFFTVFMCLASVGLPGLNNFVSEMMLLSALFTPWNTGVAGYGLAVAGAAGIFLSAWYTFTMIRKVFFGPVKTPDPADASQPADLSDRETLAFGLLAVVILALGVYPKPVLATVEGDVRVISDLMISARERVNPTLAVAEYQTPVSVPRPNVPPEALIGDRPPPRRAGPQQPPR
jgi:NADH-quinone oxidoreductase subunit M